MLWFDKEKKARLIMKRVLLCGILAISLVSLAMTQSAIPTLVLCYGDDGHRAIERAHMDSCRQASQNSQKQTAGTNAESVSVKVMSAGRHSTTCVDIPLGNDLITWQIPSFHQSFTQLIRLTRVIPTIPITYSVRNTIQILLSYLGLSAPTNNSSLFALRSVVLLN
jgi:hypothetical protein